MNTPSFMMSPTKVFLNSRGITSSLDFRIERSVYSLPFDVCKRRDFVSLPPPSLSGMSPPLKVFNHNTGTDIGVAHSVRRLCPHSHSWNLVFLCEVSAATSLYVVVSACFCCAMTLSVR